MKYRIRLNNDATLWADVEVEASSVEEAMDLAKSRAMRGEVAFERGDVQLDPWVDDDNCEEVK